MARQEYSTPPPMKGGHGRNIGKIHEKPKNTGATLKRLLSVLKGNKKGLLTSPFLSVC